MKLYAAVIFVVCLTVSLILAQHHTVFKGRCPKIPAPKNFNESQYKGKWYEIKKFPNAILPRDCGSPDYKLHKNGFAVLYTSRNITEKKNYTTHFLLKRIVIGGAPGRYDVYENNKKQILPHFVIQTDYKTYGLVWGCTYRSSSNTNIQKLFLFARKPSVSRAVVNKATDFLKNVRLDYTKLKNVIQNNKKCARRK